MLILATATRIRTQTSFNPLPPSSTYPAGPSLDGSTGGFWGLLFGLLVVVGIFVGGYFFLRRRRRQSLGARQSKRSRAPAGGRGWNELGGDEMDNENEAFELPRAGNESAYDLSATPTLPSYRAPGVHEDGGEEEHETAVRNGVRMGLDPSQLSLDLKDRSRYTYQQEDERYDAPDDDDHRDTHEEHHYDEGVAVNQKEREVDLA